ncbi:MAG: hypothetical protein DLM57_07560 [Pseudonocardiales bacterium]|nr:MAG: hypothetical protein DLM57_07560 [Pseudonocardiales bacterium]
MGEPRRIRGSAGASSGIGDAPVRGAITENARRPTGSIRRDGGPLPAYPMVLLHAASGRLHYLRQSRGTVQQMTVLKSFSSIVRTQHDVWF